MGDLRSCKSSDEMLEKRLERYPQKRLWRFLCLRAHLASRYSASKSFLRVYIEVFLKRFTQRFYTRSSFAPRKTYIDVGYVTQFGGGSKDYRFATVMESGHEVPTFKPIPSSGQSLTT